MSVGKVTQPAQRLAEELRAIRREARISQDDLARLSGVGRTTVKSIERGEQLAKPETLRLLARGAATDGAHNTDDVKASGYFERLMRAAGHVEDPVPTVGQPVAQPPADDLRQRALAALGPARAEMLEEALVELTRLKPTGAE